MSEAAKNWNGWQNDTTIPPQNRRKQIELSDLKPNKSGLTDRALGSGHPHPVRTHEDLEIVLCSEDLLLQKICHPTFNDNFNGSCPISVIFGAVITAH